MANDKFDFVARVNAESADRQLVYRGIGTEIGAEADAMEANVLRSAAMIAKRYAERAQAAGKEDAAKVAMQIANLIVPDPGVYRDNSRKLHEIWDEGNQRIGADRADSGVRPGWVDAVGVYHPQPSDDDEG